MLILLPCHSHAELSLNSMHDPHVTGSISSVCTASPTCLLCSQLPPSPHVHHHNLVFLVNRTVCTTSKDREGARVDGNHRKKPWYPPQRGSFLSLAECYLPSGKSSSFNLLVIIWVLDNVIFNYPVDTDCHFIVSEGVSMISLSITVPSATSFLSTG